MLMSEDKLTKLNKELLNATAAGDLDKVTKLLNKGADVNAQDSMGNTPLHLASKIGITYLVTKLISSYANINAKNKNNHTPLDEACFNGCEGVKDQLLMWKADFGCNFGNNPVEDKIIKERNLSRYKGTC
jgi:ankyrin repeat protein